MGRGPDPPIALVTPLPKPKPPLSLSLYRTDLLEFWSGLFVIPNQYLFYMFHPWSVHLLNSLKFVDFHSVRNERTQISGVFGEGIELGPLLAKFIFHYRKKIENHGLLLLCVSTSGHRKFSPLWNSKYATDIKFNSIEF